MHDSIVEGLRETVLALDEGVKIDTEPVLAKRYGVSVPTLRNAVLVLIMEGLLDRRQGSGTYVAPRSPLQQAPEIAMTIDRDWLSSPALCSFHLARAHALMGRMEAQGRSVALVPLVHRDGGDRAGWAELLRFLHSSSARVLVALEYLPPAILSLAESQSVTVVGIASPHRVCVAMDFVDMVQRALAEARSQNAKSVALLGWGLEGQSKILEAFSSAAASLGLETDKHWVLGDLPPSDPGSGWEAFREVWSGRPDKHPDALVVLDEALVPGILQAISELDLRVPDDVKLFVHANVPSFLPSPTLPVTRLCYAMEDFVDAICSDIDVALSGKPIPEGVRNYVTPWIERMGGVSGRILGKSGSSKS